MIVIIVVLIISIKKAKTEFNLFKRIYLRQDYRKFNKNIYLPKVVMFNHRGTFSQGFQKGIMIILFLFLTAALTQRHNLIFNDYFPDMARYRFTLRDFERLINDPGANPHSSKGGFDFLTIVPKR